MGGYGCDYGHSWSQCYSPDYSCKTHNGSIFVLIVVLFILLIIVGSVFV